MKQVLDAKSLEEDKVRELLPAACGSHSIYLVQGK